MLPLHFSFCRTTLKNEASGNEASGSVFFALRMVTVDPRSVRLAGTRPDSAVDHLVFAATAADVTSVVVSGGQIVRDRHHLLAGDVPAALDRAVTALEQG